MTVTAISRQPEPERDPGDGDTDVDSLVPANNDPEPIGLETGEASDIGTVTATVVADMSGEWIDDADL